MIGAAASISPSSQLSPGPRLNEVQLCSKIHRSHQEAGTHQGKVETICPSWSHAPGDRQRRKEQRVWGQWYRLERKWEMENRIREPTELGEEGVYHSNQREVFKGRMLPIMSIRRTVSQNVVLRTPTLESLGAGKNSVGAGSAHFRTSATGTRTKSFNRHSGVLLLQPPEFCCP